MTCLDAADSYALSNITIVGMRFYPGSYDSLIKSIRTRDETERFMFIVPEVNNTTDSNAIMLSDGRKKIGSVAASEAAVLRRVFEKWRAERGYDEVVVVQFKYPPSVDTAYDVENFKRLGSFGVKGIYRVHERLARKFAAKFNV